MVVPSGVLDGSKGEISQYLLFQITGKLRYSKWQFMKKSILFFGVISTKNIV